jgi:hypothetical protein
MHINQITCTSSLSYIFSRHSDNMVHCLLDCLEALNLRYENRNLIRGLRTQCSHHLLKSNPGFLKFHGMEFPPSIASRVENTRTCFRYTSCARKRTRALAMSVICLLIISTTYFGSPLSTFVTSQRYPALLSLFYSFRLMYLVLRF